MQCSRAGRIDQEWLMGTLMATCPITGKDIELGIETDKRSLAAVNCFCVVFHCTSCGDEHVITRRDAWVCETFGGSQEYSPTA
jgi:hypothetical protein